MGVLRERSALPAQACPPDLKAPSPNFDSPMHLSSPWPLRSLQASSPQRLCLPLAHPGS